MSALREVNQLLTKTFQVVLAQNLYTPNNFANWYNANKSIVKKLGNSYIVHSNEDFNTVLVDLFPNGTVTDEGSSVKDFGKQITIGTQDESCILVFRLVQLGGKAENNGTPDDYDSNTGYCLLENNASDVTFRPISIARV